MDNLQPKTGASKDQAEESDLSPAQVKYVTGYVWTRVRELLTSLQAIYAEKESWASNSPVVHELAREAKNQYQRSVRFKDDFKHIYSESVDMSTTMIEVFVMLDEASFLVKEMFKSVGIFQGEGNIFDLED